MPTAPDFSWYTVTFDGPAYTRRSIPNLDETPSAHGGGEEALEVVFAIPSELCLSELHQLHCTQKF